MKKNIIEVTGKDEFKGIITQNARTGNKLRETEKGHFVLAKEEGMAYRDFSDSEKYKIYVKPDKILTLDDISCEHYFIPEEAFVHSHLLLGYYARYGIDRFSSDQCSELEIGALEEAFGPLIDDTDFLSEHNIKVSNLVGHLSFDGEKFGVYDTYYFEQNPKSFAKLHDYETLKDYNREKVLDALLNELAVFSGDETIRNESNSDDLFKHLKQKPGKTISKNNKRR